MYKQVVLCANGGLLKYIRSIWSEEYELLEVIEAVDELTEEKVAQKTVFLGVSWHECERWLECLKRYHANRVIRIPVFVMQYGINIFGDDCAFARYTSDIDIQHDSIMTYLETHVTDICNLKCKGCMHFSNLATSPNEPSVESFKKDMIRVRQLFDHIFIVRLLGGEPLLSKNLEQYVEIVREVFPATELRIVTNGVLIPKMDAERINVLREQKVAMDISPYPPTVEKLNEITAFLDGEKIPYGTISSQLSDFRKSLTIKPGNDVQKSMKICGSAHCHFLRNGKIAKCPLCFFIEDFDAQYGFDIHSKDIFDIYQEADGKVLREKLERPADLCAYCPDHPEFIPWDTTRGDAKVSDWVVDYDL